MKGIYKLDLFGTKDIHVNKNTVIKDYVKHWHNYYEIIYYSGCDGECILNGESYEITKDCLFMLTLNDFHEIKPRGGEDAFYIIIGFNEFAPAEQLLQKINNGPYIIHNTDKTLSDKIVEMYDEFQKDYEFGDIYLSGLLNCVLTKILSNGTVVTNKASVIHKSVKNAISYITSNPGADINLNELARKYNLAPAYFSKLFHQNTGITFKKFLNSRRIEYARKLLKDNDLSVTEAALESGFSTHSQFVAVFKSLTGMTPSEYRKLKKDSN